MATSIAIILVLGLSANAVFRKMKLPGLLGMILLGAAIGPYALNWIDADTLRLSGEFRKLALIIILLRAGLGISRNEMKKVGVASLKISIIPGLIEGFAVALISVSIFGFSFVEGAILGFILSPVSLAVIVPEMLNYIEKGLGSQKNVPAMMLAASSLDNVFCMTLFAAFISLYSEKHMDIGHELLSIPMSVILGSVIGLIIGYIMVRLFTEYHIRDTKKVLMIIGSAIFITAIENALKKSIDIAGLIGVMMIGIIILARKPEVAVRLSAKFNKIWIFAELLLFVLIGTQINIALVIKIGLKGLLILFIGIVGRSIGVVLATIRTNLNKRERAFCVVTSIPKATVQAAIGAIPMSLGIPSGEIILAVTVISILVTAPLGAIAIRSTAVRLLSAEPGS